MRRIAAVAAVTAMLGAVGFVASPAAAQTGYPPGPCIDVSSSQNVGVVAGSTLNFNITPTCVFAVGSNVSVVVNNINTVVKPATDGGTVPISITILSSTQLSVEGVLVPAICGINKIVATGPSGSAGKVVTHTVLFELVCPPGFEKKLEEKGKETKVAFTGANVLRWSAIALGCVGVGALVVSSSRKRRQRTPELVD